MKRLILTIIVISLGLTASAQQEHFKFKGIEMNCSVETFVGKLLSQGFEYAETNEDNLPILRGEFSGDKCLLTVLDNLDGLVCGVLLFLDYNDCSWGTILDGLEYYEDGLTKKYGRPKKVVKRFKYPYKKGSGYELAGFRLGKNSYNIHWETNIGRIGLGFASAQNTAIFLTYIDKANTEADAEREFEDL